MGDNGTVHSGVPEKQLLLRYNKEETDLQSHTMHVFILYKLIFTYVIYEQFIFGYGCVRNNNVRK